MTDRRKLFMTTMEDRASTTPYDPGTLFWVWQFIPPVNFWMKLGDANFFYKTRFIVDHIQILDNLVASGIQPSRIVTHQELRYLFEDEIWHEQLREWGE